MAHSGNVTFIAVLFAIICATDIFDGRLARKFMAETKIGAIFDVAADLFFITSAYLVLIYQNVIPIWILAIVLLKFLEFCITSFILKKNGESQNSVFFFDIVGRTVVLLFYALPIVMIILRQILTPELLFTAINIICCVLAIMAFSSSLYRIKICSFPKRL
jgi:CDP-diacylglycerol--glycerol-3-phosphate 3-phosphatidyltransferase